MKSLSLSMPGQPGDLFGGDLLWLIDAHVVEALLVAMLVVSLRAQFKRWGRMHH